jgi:hypothetical protein
MYRLKKLITVVGMIIFVLVVISCSRKTSKVDSTEVLVVESQSHFNKFEIIDQKVYIHTIITLQNNSNETKEILIKGNFAKDKEIYLVEEEILQGINKETSEEIFIIEKSSTKEYNVVFVREWGGGEQRNDRLLPPIYIEILSK